MQGHYCPYLLKYALNRYKNFTYLWRAENCHLATRQHLPIHFHVFSLIKSCPFPQHVLAVSSDAPPNNPLPPVILVPQQHSLSPHFPVLIMISYSSTVTPTIITHSFHLSATFISHKDLIFLSKIIKFLHKWLISQLHLSSFLPQHL